MHEQGAAIEAMRAVATAHQQRSLQELEAALSTHAEHLGQDPIISTHLNQLYDMLLQENICRIIEPYSRVETAHIATVMKLSLRVIEEKLSQMILDKKFKGILDAGAGCLVVYDEESPDLIYEQSLETLGNMSKVVDALYVKANKITAPPEEKKEDKKEGDKDAKDKDKGDKKKDDKKDKK